ncbi:hypothetical protein K438DRAFT_2131885 [Mycena galopus ATCC 62051]|nr:hypothetical protein K438DRAFT_2131885 [Mycena galopus ATCC 62051]
MRLTKLNGTRMLAGKIAELDLHKQLMMAIATSDEHRISHLIRAGLNNGESIGVILERFYRACVDVHREGPKYNPKGFTQDDYMVGLCVLRLGGTRLADILHRALGLPGLTTLRKHSVIKPLRASPAMPTIAEIEANIDAYTEGEETPAGPPNPLNFQMAAAMKSAERKVNSADSNVTVDRSRGRPVRKKRKAAQDVECICGRAATLMERESSAVQCARAGCETIWFHIECVPRDIRKGWVCQPCGNSKKRR